MQLSQVESKTIYDVPRELAGQVKRLATDPSYAKLWDWLCNDLGWANKVSYVAGQPDARDLMIWFEGRRHVGTTLLLIAAERMPEPEAPEPRPRTLVEKGERRRRVKP